MKICFVLIAERDYDFFDLVGRQLTTRGHTVTLLDFHTPHKLLKNIGSVRIVFFQDLYRARDNEPFALSDWEDSWLLHERLTHEEPNDFLRKKGRNYEAVIDKFLKAENFDYVIQELGGFIAPLSIYRSCKKNAIKHLFIEPTFFQGHLGFIQDALNYKVSEKVHSEILFDSIEFIREMLAKKPSVIPNKDKHHFKDAKFGKFININNIRSFLKKMFCRRVLKLDFEYKYTWVFLRRAIKSIANRKFLGRWNQKNLNRLGNQAGARCYFYPFHVKLDFSLTVRAPESLDQIANINRVLDVIGKDDFLVVKEHPASIGAYGVRDLKRISDRSRIIWVDPSVSTFDIIERCEAVFTVNSKVGVEALISKKPVYCLSDSYYLGAGLAQPVEAFNILANDDWFVCEQRLKNFLTNLKVSSYRCELYDYSQKNITQFADAILHVIEKKSFLNVR